MESSPVREFHVSHGATFLDRSGAQVPLQYGDSASEFNALNHSAAIFDLSFRSRLCVLGADRAPFLHGQVTNEVKKLQKGQNVYAALVNAKGKMESDLFIHNLGEELLLDFEPGLSEKVQGRLEKYVIAEDVQIADAKPFYGLISLQGPQSEELLRAVFPSVQVPAKFQTIAFTQEAEFYLGSVQRLGAAGFDLFVPIDSLAATLQKLLVSGQNLGAKMAGWETFETARVVAGIPRFGADMDDTILAPEAGIEARAISYHKGCYIGQEIISRIRTYGRVAKSLRHLHFQLPVSRLPRRDDPITAHGKEVGFVTSAARIPGTGAVIGLGYIRHEVSSGAAVDIMLDGHASRATNERVA